MLYYRQITGTDHGVEGRWFIELDETGARVSELDFIPVETIRDVVSVWSIVPPIGDDAGIIFTEHGAANLALITMLPSMADLKGRDAGTSSPLASRPRSPR